MLHTDQIWIDPAYRLHLAACQLVRVGDILARVNGRIAAWSRTTDTLHVPGADGGPGFYVKRYFYPTWRKRLRGFFRGTFLGAHRGQAEQRALRIMRRLGISAVRPVAYGARRIGHFVVACFLITEEAPQACNLTTFAGWLESGAAYISPGQRRAAIRRLGEQVAHMHAAGFSHGQLFWRNIVTRAGPDGAHEFFFLDAQPLHSWQRVGGVGPWWAQELAHLAVSALPFTTRTERLRFLRTYFGAARLDARLKEHARLISERAQRWRRHELQRIRMNDLFEEWNRQLQLESVGSPGLARRRAPVGQTA